MRERSHPALLGVPRQPGTPDVAPEERGDAISEGEHTPGARGEVEPVRKDQNQSEHDRRVEEDPGREAERTIPLPEEGGRVPRQQQHVVEQRRGGHRDGGSRRQVAKQDREEPVADVDETAEVLPGQGIGQEGAPRDAQAPCFLQRGAHQGTSFRKWAAVRMPS